MGYICRRIKRVHAVVLNCVPEAFKRLPHSLRIAPPDINRC